jgi:hypothetical protein
VLWFCHDFDVYLIYLGENTFVKGEKVFSERKLIKILKSRRGKFYFLFFCCGEEEKEEEKR